MAPSLEELGLARADATAILGYIEGYHKSVRLTAPLVQEDHVLVEAGTKVTSVRQTEDPLVEEVGFANGKKARVGVNQDLFETTQLGTVDEHYATAW